MRKKGGKEEGREEGRQITGNAKKNKVVQNKGLFLRPGVNMIPTPKNQRKHLKKYETHGQVEIWEDII